MINPRGVEPVEPSFFDGLNMFQHPLKLPQKDSLKKKACKDSLTPGSVVKRTNKSLISLL